MNAAAGPGPFRAADLPSGSRYELRDGHALYCAPTGGDGASRSLVGARVLATDPSVKEAGLDAGYALAPGTLYAPDIAIGNVPSKPGWIAGVPPLAVEYAGSGQDEERLQLKIADFLEAGTRWVWVVRLVGPRRVEVYAQGEPTRVVVEGEALLAPGILYNPVRVEELFDPAAAREAELRNLLQRQGYASLEDLRAKERDEGQRRMLLKLLTARFGALPEAALSRVNAASSSDLERWADRVLTASSLIALLE